MNTPVTLLLIVSVQVAVLPATTGVAHVVLADGRSVRAAAGEHPDLYWGLRGGAGGLGVVTSLEFRLYPLAEVLAGLVIFPGDQSAAVLRRFRDFVQDAPDEFCGMAVLISPASSMNRVTRPCLRATQAR